MIPRLLARARPLGRIVSTSQPAARASGARGMAAAAAASKIKVDNPVVEIDGDEMARIIWHKIRDQLVLPYLDIDLKYYDLGIHHRDATDDKVTVEAAHAIKEYGAGVKAATITHTPERLEEFGFTKMYRSPNGTIRNILNGTIMREPILTSNVPRLVTTWNAPIIIARHGHADQYRATDFVTHESGGKLTFKFEPNDKSSPTIEHTVYDFQGPGVALAMYNTDESITSFARASLGYARERGFPCILGTKNTILKQYDGRFTDIFYKVAAEEYPDVPFEMRLIDDLVAFQLKHEQSVLYALKNYDGDVLSDVVAQGFGSLGMMSSVCVSPDGKIAESEAAHGTVTRHYRAHQRGEETSTNPVASVYAWTRGLAHRGRLDGNQALIEYCSALEKACIDSVEGGCMTKDLSICSLGWDKGVKRENWATTDEFLSEVKSKMESSMA